MLYMNNLVTLLHERDYDRPELLAKTTRRKLPFLDEIREIFFTPLIEINSESGCGVHMRYFFTNIFDKQTKCLGQKAISIGFFPVHERVDYVFREDLWFWIKPDADMIEMKNISFQHDASSEYWQSYTRQHRLYLNRLLFYRNPMNGEKAAQPFYGK